MVGIPTSHFSPITSHLSHARLSRALPGGSANHSAEIPALERCIFVRQDVGFYIPECRLWLVLNPVIERLDDILLEMRGSRVRLYNRLALSISILGIGKPEHVHFDARSY